jgi:erythromycin esterase-like protein
MLQTRHRISSTRSFAASFHVSALLVSALLTLTIGGHVSLAQELPSGINRLQSLDFDADVKDLAPVDRWVSQARVVGVGESAHGVASFTQLRGRLVRRLVETQGFRAIFVEDFPLPMQRVDGFLQQCTKPVSSGTDKSPVPAAELTAAMKEFRAGGLASKEWIPALTWLCSFNRAHPSDRVQIFGTDIWDAPWDLRPMIQAVLTLLNDKRLNNTLVVANRNCMGWRLTSWKSYDKDPGFKTLEATKRANDDGHRRCVGALVTLHDKLDDSDDKRLAKIDPHALLWAKLAIYVALTAEQFRDLYAIDYSKALTLRDTAQAWIIIHQLDDMERIAKPAKGADSPKAVYLAHNLHIAKQQSAVMTQDPDIHQWQGTRSTGEFLRGQYGASYRSIALTGYALSGSADGAYPVPQAKDSLDVALAAFGAAVTVDVDSTLLRKFPFWWMHLEKNPNGEYLVPQQQYDGIIFVKESAATTAFPDKEKSSK